MSENTKHERLMTRQTYDKLIALKQRLSAEIAEAGEGAGSGHARAGYHDDPGHEHARNATRGRLLLIGDLSEVKFIEPRREIDRVGIGNRIKLDYGDGEPEEALLLGSDDFTYGDHQQFKFPIVSAFSPIGEKILGQPKGTKIDLKLDEKRQIKVRIADVLPGDF